MKTKNPFKLWGSYIGAFIYTIGPFIIQKIGALKLGAILYSPFYILFRIIPCHDYGCLGLWMVIFVIVAPTIGFTAGYYIHKMFLK